MPRLAALSIIVSLASPLSPSAAESPADPGAGSFPPASDRTAPIIESSRSPGPLVGPGTPDLVPQGYWSDLWERHRWHLLTVLALEEAEQIYHDAVGVSTSPKLFGDPPSFDVAIHDRLASAAPTRNFVTENKTNLFRGIALASLAATYRLDIGGMADDFLGLLEAVKFNTATNSLIKMMAGRERPDLGLGDPNEIGQVRSEQLRNSEGQHLSFYSAATSEAFTMASYVDLMLAEGLEDHPGARWSLASGLYGLAGYVGYSRLEQGEHYFTDVAAGATAGILIGRGFHRAHHGDAGGEDTSGFHLSPPVPIPGGLFVSVSFTPRRRVAR